MVIIKTSSGNDAQAACMGGDIAGDTNTGATVTYTATTLTDTAKAWTTNQWTGHTVVSGAVYMTVTSNTATVLTGDRWYVPATPGGAAGTTPSANATYAITPGNSPYWYVGVSTDTATVVAGDTALTSEVVAAGSGCLRKLGTYAHTTGVASYSLAATWTYVAADQTFGSRVLAKIAVFNTLTGTTGRMLFATLLAQTATLTATGDQLTVTDTVSN